MDEVSGGVLGREKKSHKKLRHPAKRSTPKTIKSREFKGEKGVEEINSLSSIALLKQNPA